MWLNHPVTVRNKQLIKDLCSENSIHSKRAPIFCFFVPAIYSKKIILFSTMTKTPFLPSDSMLFLSFLWLLVVPIPASAATSTPSRRIIIHEIMALNETGLADEDGDHSDWIELYNPGDHSINLAGWSLTDEAENPGKWIFLKLR